MADEERLEDEEDRRDWLPDDRERELDDLLVLLRDPDGEDVRVAMVGGYRDNPTSPMRHTP